MEQNPKAISLNTFYDLIVRIDSMLSLKEEGWKLIASENNLKNTKIMKENKAIIIGFLDTGNSDNTFIIQKLLFQDKAALYNKPLTGLYVKYGLLDKQSHCLFLSKQGLENPMMSPIEQDQNQPQRQQEEENKQILLNKERTDLFLEGFILANSYIIVGVVGQLNYSEQKKINVLKNTFGNTEKANQYFIVHYLNDFEEINQVEEYIEQILMKSISFKLEKRKMASFKSESNDTQKKNDVYYTEEHLQKDEQLINIVHLIMAKEGSNAGKYYNESAIEFLKLNALNYSIINKCSILDSFTDYLVKKSRQFFENVIKVEDVELSPTAIKITKIRNEKGTEDSQAKLQHSFDNPYIIKSNRDDFKPKCVSPNFRYYIEGNYFVINLEISGAITNFRPSIIDFAQMYMFVFQGDKSHLNYNKNGADMFSSIETGYFYVQIQIPRSQITLKNKQIEKYDAKNGILTFYFLLQQP